MQDDFKHPVTRLINKKKNIVQITPKKDTTNEINETNLSDCLTQLFPDIDEVEEEKVKDKNNEMEIDQVTEILARTDNDTIPL